MRQLEINVYDAMVQRFDLLFQEFDNIYVSFSGGKDSGVLLKLLLLYMRKKRIAQKIGVYHQDFEAQYTETTKYVERTLNSDQDFIKVYWQCLPMSCKTATSQYEQYWVPWDKDKQDIWVRPMPEHDGVINIHNHQFDFYQYAMMEDDLTHGFGSWYHRYICGGKGKTIGLLGLRTQENLNHWRAINAEKSMYENLHWTTKMADNVYSGYPIYDWKTEDVWGATAKHDFDYNNIYDLFYWAGSRC